MTRRRASPSLRVAQVLTASTGGIGRHVAELTGQLLDRGHRVQVWCPVDTAEQHFADLITRGLPVHPRLDRAVLGADVVHAHGYKATGWVLPVARLGRIPVVSTWHNRPPTPDSDARRVGQLLGALSQRLAARADLVLGASSDLVAAARVLGASARVGPVPAPRLSPPRRDRADVRRTVGTPHGTAVVLTVGRLAPQKNLGMLVEVATRLVGRPDVEFWVAGTGPEHPRLARSVSDRRLRVRLLGFRTDVADLLAAADVALLTSHWEARALFAQEAMAAGLPLVGTRVGGMAELVGDAAVLVEPGDVSAAALAIRRLTDQPHRRSELAARGRAQAATWPTADQAVELVVEGYADVLRRRSQ